MDKHFIITLLSLMLATCHVKSFTISSRHERSTDLAEALAILQRQRRRAIADYPGSDRLLNGRPYAMEDDGDWLRTPSVVSDRFRNNIDSDWVSNGRFKDFDSSPEYIIPLDRSRSPVPVYVEPSRQELENIFDAENEDRTYSNLKLNAASFPEKKKKEEMVNVRGDGKIIQKKSYPLDITEDVAAISTDSNDGLSLDTLTKDEFHALMRAVDKLQKQAVTFSEKTIETPEAKITKVEAIESNGEPKEVTIVQPASKEDLRSVFEGEDTPVVKETEVIVEREPNSSGERIIQKQVVSNVSPKKVNALKEKEIDLINVIASELEDNIAEEAEKAATEAEDIDIAVLNGVGNRDITGLERDWLTRNYESPSQKRTSKRAAAFSPRPVTDLDINDIADDINTKNNDVIEGLNSDFIPPNVERFVERILQLQNEVDNLKIVSKLEDLENDVLTDALNEATLAQKEGSVTDMEFESLQQAIRIEEALQKLKHSEGSKKYQVEIIKKGEPWRRKRVPSNGNDIDIISDDNLPSYSLSEPSAIALRPVINDVQSSLEQSRLNEEIGPDGEVASFFMSNADECPAVQEYSTNCELADVYSLPVDFEARSLCNLHEMCYACGNSLQVGQDQCDLVYRAAASALCRGKQNCVVESEIFLRTMKLKNRYIPHSQPLCRSTCVAEFLGML